MEDTYLYGIHPVLETLTANRRTFYEALVQTGLRHPRAKQLRAALTQRKIPIRDVDKHELAQTAKTREHQGVVLRCGDFPYSPLELAWREKLVLLLDNVEDPHNIGALLRSAEGMGIKHVLLPQKGCPGIYASVVKASAGAAEHMRITQDRNTTSYYKLARKEGFQVAALDGSGAISLPDWEPPQDPLLLVIGGEDRAVGQYLLNEADQVLSIPQQGNVTSFNASVAGALAMYQWFLRKT